MKENCYLSNLKIFASLIILYASVDIRPQSDIYHWAHHYEYHTRVLYMLCDNVHIWHFTVACVSHLNVIKNEVPILFMDVRLWAHSIKYIHNSCMTKNRLWHMNDLPFDEYPFAWLDERKKIKWIVRPFGLALIRMRKRILLIDDCHLEFTWSRVFSEYT